MHDSPAPELLIAQVRQALEDGLAPGFPQKVAANALGIGLRELTLGTASSVAECERLNRLLGCDSADLGDLNRLLAEGIRDGSSVGGPDLVAHLIRTTIDKLEVDQPGYPAFRAWKDARAPTA